MSELGWWQHIVDADGNLKITTSAAGVASPVMRNIATAEERSAAGLPKGAKWAGMFRQQVHNPTRQIMAKPLVIMVGADKGGVGKTTLSRALDVYVQQRLVIRRVFDGEWPKGDLRQFAPEASVVDMASVDDQMRVFDRLAGVTLIDIKAGMFTEVLGSLSRTGLLDDVRDGRFNLALLHVLGPSAASLFEIEAIAGRLGTGATHLLVKNYINEGGFREWDSDPRFAEALTDAGRIVTVPHLEARASTEVQRLGMGFAAYLDDPAQSRMLVGYVRAWLNDSFAAFTGAGLQNLIEQTKG